MKTNGKKPQRKTSSIQQHFVSARAARNQVIELAPRTPGKAADYIAIIEVSSINLEFMSVEEQIAVFNSYRSFLNSIDFHIQILIRTLPLDIRPYLLRMNAFARQINSDLLRRLAQDHITFVLTMMKERALLGRKFYIVIPDTQGNQDVAPNPLLTLFGQQNQRRERRERSASLVFQRADKIIVDLSRMGLSGKILAGFELAQVYHESFNVERAIRRPLTQNHLDGVDVSLTDVQFPSLSGQGTSARSASAKAPGKIQRSGISAPASGRDKWVLPNMSDLVAPTSIELERDHLVIDDRYVQTLAVTAYPRYLNAGWLAQLVEMPEPMDVSLHFHPQDSATVMRKLSRRLSELESSARMNRQRGRVDDPQNLLGIQDIDELRTKLQRGDERFFASSMYVCLRAASLDKLNERVQHITNELDSLLIESRPCVWEEDLGFLSCIPEARDRLLRTHSHDTSTLTMAFPFMSSSLSMSEGILYGSAPNGTPIIIDTFDQSLENANKVIFAKSGAGKSFGCKVEAMRNIIRGIDTYIIDPENEYWPIAQYIGGQVVRLAVGSPNRINPFDITADVIDDTVDVVAEKIQSLHLFFNLLLANRSATGFTPLTQLEVGLLDRCMKVLYQQSGITGDPATHKRPMPLLKDLQALLKSGSIGADTSNLAERLAQFTEGSNELFAEQTNIRLDKSFIVFNIRDMDSELRPIALFLITDFIWGQIRNRTGRPRQLIIDEAWTLMQFTEGGQFVAGLSRRARKYFLSLVTITQDVQDFLNNEHGRTVLANSSLKLLMKQDSTTIRSIADSFKLSDNERQFLLECDKGQGLLFVRQNRVGIQIEASPMEYSLATTDPREAHKSAVPKRQPSQEVVVPKADGA